MKTTKAATAASIARPHNVGQRSARSVTVTFTASEAAFLRKLCTDALANDGATLETWPTVRSEMLGTLNGCPKAELAGDVRHLDMHAAVLSKMEAEGGHTMNALPSSNRFDAPLCVEITGRLAAAIRWNAFVYNISVEKQLEGCFSDCSRIAVGGYYSSDTDAEAWLSKESTVKEVVS